MLMGWHTKARSTPQGCPLALGGLVMVRPAAGRCPIRMLVLAPSDTYHTYPTYFIPPIQDRHLRRREVEL